MAEGTRKPGTRVVAKKGRKMKKTGRAVDPSKRVRSRLTLRERKVLVAITSALTGKLR